MRLLITGGCGFLGTNLGEAALQRNYELAILDNLSRLGASENLRWLQSQGESRFFHTDIRNYNDVERIIKDFRPDAVFHLAGQVAMTASLQDPRMDFEVNVVGGHNVLESVRRHRPECVLIYSSTNKIYGDLEWVGFREAATRYVVDAYPDGFDESMALDFQSPYGCSKGAVDQYMLDYHRMFGVPTVVFRHSSIFGGRQFSSYDQGWIGWFVRQALDIKNGRLKEPFTISGNGKQVRDVLFASDLVECYFMAWKHIDKARGQAFNIGGSMANSLSLLELLSMLEAELGTILRYRKLPPRVSDQKVFVANTAKASTCFGWRPLIKREEGIQRMIEWVGSVSA